MAAAAVEQEAAAAGERGAGELRRRGQGSCGGVEERSYGGGEQRSWGFCRRSSAESEVDQVGDGSRSSVCWLGFDPEEGGGWSVDGLGRR